MDPDSPFPPDLGARVQAARGYINMSREEFGDLTDIGDRAAVRRLEEGGLGRKGDRRTRRRLQRIADLTGLPYEFFFVPWEELPALMELKEREDAAETIRKVRDAADAASNGAEGPSSSRRGPSSRRHAS
jgi:transcriptional regulator with XRE-family HTH domain